MSKLIDEISNNVPLKTKIRVLNEMAFIDLIIELGFREDKFWTEEEDGLLEKLMKLAEEHTNLIMKEIESDNGK